jgi:maleylpyruvate isomerase
MSAVQEFQIELAESTSRLLATTARLTDDDVRAPSRLPGWTRGHVLTHLARNADGLVNLLTWARTGVVTPQYPTPATRAAEIDAGAVRPAKELLADVGESAEQFRRACDGMPYQAWSGMVAGMRPPDHPAWYVLARRIREVEVHHADLGMEYGWADWPRAYVQRELYDTMLSWPRGDGPVSEIVSRERRGDGGHVRVWRGLGHGPAVQGAPGAPGTGLIATAPAEKDADQNHDGPRSTPPSAEPSDTLPSPPPWLVMPAPPTLPAEPPHTWPPGRD